MLIVATLPSQADTGAVRFRVGSAGFIIGVGGGSGTLTFHGKTYPLRIGGVSVGMIGVSSADLVGRARNLRRASDIAGTYTAVGAGLAIAGGAATARLQNANGVVLEVRGTKVGFRRRSTSADCRYRCNRPAALVADWNGNPLAALDFWPRQRRCRGQHTDPRSHPIRYRLPPLACMKMTIA